ncbi:MAG: molybdopterin-synthase adenylyltransferase MoeB [Deltaproteobacteria bacterium]|nr:MAG: molybdopterin-synthase adenylyltransferase MoeB [Deltaproteobacteria bacterium]
MSEPLSPAERARYARHLSLPEIGEAGQRILRDRAVVVVGAGGLGSPCLLYLAAAGVGRLGLVDFDNVDVSNLQRQVLYGQADVGAPKVSAAERRLGDLNPHITIEPHAVRLSADNALSILGSYDLVIDGSDRFSTRYLVSDACEILGKPLVYAAIQSFEGQLAVFNHEGGPTLRDLFPEPPPPGLAPRCAEVGVLGVLPGLLGTLQASEALKVLLGIGEPLCGRLLLIDALRMTFRSLRLARDPSRAAIHDLSAHAPPPWQVLDPSEAASRLREGWAPALIDVRTQAEAEVDQIAGTALRCEPQDILPSGLPLGEVLIYCASGGRSTRVARALLDQGVAPARLHELRGGLQAWRAAGY